MLRTQWTLPVTINVGIVPFKGDVNIRGDKDNADEMIYTFQKELLDRTDLNDSDAPSIDRCNTDNDCKCGMCFDGICESNCLKTETCVKRYRYALVGVLQAGKCDEWECCACDNRSAIVYVAGQEENCSVCPNMFVNPLPLNPICFLRCSADKLLIRYTGESCHTCDEPNPVDVGYRTTSACSDICPNRKMENGICSREKCSAGNDLVDKNDDCYPCNIALSVDVGGNKTKCDKCINRKMQGNFCVLR